MPIGCWAADHWPRSDRAPSLIKKVSRFRVRKYSWNTSVSRDKKYWALDKWSLIWWGSNSYGHWQTESIQPTDRGVFALHWPDWDKAEIITLLDTSHGGNFDPSSCWCPLSMLLQLIRAAPINSFPGQSLIKYWWPSQLLNKTFLFVHRTYSCIKLTINLYFSRNVTLGFCQIRILLDCQVSLFTDNGN